MTRNQPNAAASNRVSRPLGNGRFCVRGISISRSISNHWLRVLALPAIIAVAINVWSQIHHETT